MRTLIALLILLSSVVAHASSPAEQWFTVLLDGRKIGSFEQTRVVDEERVTTTQRLQVALDRAGTSVDISSTETSVEGIDGTPLAFSSRSRLSNQESVIEGRLDGERLLLRVQQAGEWSEREMAWPKGALLAEAQQLSSLRAGLSAGTRLTQLTWQPSSASTASVTSHVGALERVDLPQGRRQLHRIQQTMNSADTVIESTLWVDQDYAVHKLLMPMLGMELTLLRCDRRCATAPNQSADIFSRTLMSAPRALTASELRDDLRYRLRSPQLHSATQMPDTGEQRVHSDTNGIVVDVRMHAQGHAQTPPSDSDYAANDWLQSSAPEIIALARRGSGDGTDARSRMRNLETFVRNFIVDKDLSTGYASALEVARDPRGDCTEHAVLLAALGRAQGIATRTVNGLAYSHQFAGQKNVFVPHAWVQAWTGERWESFDAALMGFDSGHIALSIGDGDPWRFFSGLELLGTLQLEAADSLPSTQSP